MSASTARASPRFRAIERMRADHYGETWKGFDDRLHRTVTIVFAAPRASPRALAHFADRAVRASRVSEPHLAMVYDTGRLDGRLFVATEVLEGVALSEMGTLAPREAAGVVGAVASALEALHAVGTAHGGVSADNVKIGTDGRAKLGPPVFGRAEASTDEDVAGLRDVARALLPGGTAPDPIDRATTPSVVAGAFRRAAVSAEVTEPIVVEPTGSSSPVRVAGLLSSPIPEPSPRITAYVVVFALVSVLLAFAVSADRSATARAAPPQATAAPPVTAVTPSVTGKSVADAGRLLIEAGFASPIRWFVEPGATGPACSVVRQEPGAGAPYQRGARAVLLVTQGC